MKDVRQLLLILQERKCWKIFRSENCQLIPATGKDVTKHG